MLINKNKDFSEESVNFDVIGLVTTDKEYKIAWHLNKLFDINLIKKSD